MDRDQLAKMRLEALRILATERGVADAHQLDRAELIDRLAPAPRGIVDRARAAMAQAAERVEESAHELAERLRATRPEAPAPPATRPPPRTLRAGFDVPSSTVLPHAEELETLTMARRYAEEGQTERAREVLAKLLAAQPGEPGVVELAEALGLAGSPPPLAAPRPQAGQAAEPFGMLDWEELPETYGVDECEVLYRDPHTVFVYWEMTEDGIAAARAQLGASGPAARRILRLFWTLTNGGRALSDLELDWNHGRRYEPCPYPGARLRIAIGLLSPEGYFAPVCHSSVVRIPPARPSLELAQEWMEVVPGRRRGLPAEPLVIVLRDGDHLERAPEVSEVGPASGSSLPHPPGPLPPGSSLPQPPGGSSAAGPAGRREGKDR